MLAGGRWRRVGKEAACCHTFCQAGMRHWGLPSGFTLGAPSLGRLSTTVQLPRAQLAQPPCPEHRALWLLSQGSAAGLLTVDAEGSQGTHCPHISAVPRLTPARLTPSQAK